MTKGKKLAAVFALAASFVIGGGAGYAIGHVVPANAKSGASARVRIGSIQNDGTVFAGISPNTQKSMYTTGTDAPGIYMFAEAQAYCSTLTEDGHKDWRDPSKDELDLLWGNRDEGMLRGTFNQTGSDPSGWYMSSSPNDDFSGWAQRFSDGLQGKYYVGRYGGSSLRCVR